MRHQRSEPSFDHGIGRHHTEETHPIAIVRFWSEGQDHLETQLLVFLFLDRHKLPQFGTDLLQLRRRQLRRRPDGELQHLRHDLDDADRRPITERRRQRRARWVLAEVVQHRVDLTHRQGTDQARVIAVIVDGALLEADLVQNAPHLLRQKHLPFRAETVRQLEMNADQCGLVVGQFRPLRHEAEAEDVALGEEETGLG